MVWSLTRRALERGLKFGNVQVYEKFKDRARE